MNYWLDLFVGKTWREFQEAGSGKRIGFAHSRGLARCREPGIPLAAGSVRAARHGCSVATGFEPVEGERRTTLVSLSPSPFEGRLNGKKKQLEPQRTPRTQRTAKAVSLKRKGMVLLCALCVLCG